MRVARVCKICFEVTWRDADDKDSHAINMGIAAGNQNGGFGGRRWWTCGCCYAEIQMSSLPY